MSAEVACVIAGGGPAGLMLGYLLARAGIRVEVLEKHGDFLRDFRGDTIHPSTMEALAELGLLDSFLRLPHQQFGKMVMEFEDTPVQVADFSVLKATAPFVAMMPQWDFLDFLADRARQLPCFGLRMRTEAVGLVGSDTRIEGLRAVGPEGEYEIRAALVVAADGRHSRLREAAGLEVRTLGAPIDVLWFRLPRQPADPPETLGRIKGGRICIMLDRGDYWQCAFVVAKGSAGKVKARGLDAFRAEVAAATGLGPARAEALADWEAVKLLDVRVDRLRRWWRPGFLAIGDAAHAMSPVGGVGVNLAVADAVAAANLLHRALAARTLRPQDLEAVQTRREWPTRAMQAVQVMAQARVILPLLAGGGRAPLPLPFRLLRRWPALSRFPARLIGLGLRQEHVAAAIRGG